MKLDVVSIGTELLLGFTLDTNIADIGRLLADAGLAVDRHLTVADRPPAIRDAVAAALEHADVVVTTGGLGPTRDDMTKAVVAELLGLRLVLDPVVLAQLEERFRRFGRAMPAANRSQAEVPEGATVLPNPRGTAPGLWVQDGAGRVVIMLPGVPHEMRGLMREQVLPRLARLAADRGGSSRVVRSKTLRTTGVAESAIAERVSGTEEVIAPLTLAYLPGPPGVDLRVTAWGLEQEDAARRLDAAVGHLTPLLARDYYGADATDLAAVVLDLLRRRGLTLAVAESCTGGLIGGRLTAVPGASETFVGGVVAYDNTVKRSLLGVPAALLDQHGAVSEPVVRAMADGAARVFGTGAAAAVTGIAGPSGGSAEKPVGTVWMAARVGDETRALRRVLPGDRAEIRERAAQAALDLLRRLLEPG